MVDAGPDFAIPFYSGQTNVAVGASSTPIHVAALVVQIGRGHRLLQESLHPGFPFSIHQLGIQNDAARGEACSLSLQVRIHEHHASPNRACIEPAAAWSNDSLPTSSPSQRRIDACHRCSIQAMPRPISQPMTPDIHRHRWNDRATCLHECRRRQAGKVHQGLRLLRNRFRPRTGGFRGLPIVEHVRSCFALPSGISVAQVPRRTPFEERAAYLPGPCFRPLAPNHAKTHHGQR